MLQKARKIGRFPPSGRRICRRRPLSQIQLSPTVDSQPFDFQMTIFSYLLQQKFALIFQIKQPLFLEKGTNFCLPIPSTSLVGDSGTLPPALRPGENKIFEEPRLSTSASSPPSCPLLEEEGGPGGKKASSRQPRPFSAQHGTNVTLSVTL